MTCVAHKPGCGLKAALRVQHAGLLTWRMEGACMRHKREAWHHIYVIVTSCVCVWDAP